MDKYDEIMNLLKEGIPFALARFNDGEMMGIENVGAVVARGDQQVDYELHNRLKAAISHSQKNYWKGMPCGTCFPKHRKLFDKLAKKDEYLTHAVVFCNNGHWSKFIEQFAVNTCNKNVAWVSGADQDLTTVGGMLDLGVSYRIRVPQKNAWQKYNQLKKSVSEFEPGSVVVISCGPMSRVLACEWFQERQDCTFLDAGSLFDPFTRDVWHDCHKGTLKYCKECNFE